MLPKQIREASRRRLSLRSLHAASACRTGAVAAMRTLILSDLHLGSVSAVLRRPSCGVAARGVAEVERVVLLGDVLELRHGPMREAMEAARGVLRGSRTRARRDGELVLVAGNHDHALIEPWLARRGEEDQPPPLGVEQLLEPAAGLARARAHRRMGLPARDCAWPTRACGCARTCTPPTGTTSTAI